MLVLWSALILAVLGFSSAPHAALADSPTPFAARAAAEDGDEPGEPGDPGDPGEPNAPADPNEPTSSEPESDPTLDPNTRIVAAEQNTNNNWGCDTDVPGTSSMSAGQWGACCDVHDSCYEMYNCTAKSWSGAEGADCNACNQAVFSCMLTIPGPGPSLCTIPENNHPCGTYRSGPR